MNESSNQIINELYQVLLKHNLTVADAISFLNDTKTAVQQANKLCDCQIRYGTLGDLKKIKVFPHKGLEKKGMFKMENLGHFETLIRDNAFGRKNEKEIREIAIKINEITANLPYGLVINTLDTFKRSYMKYSEEQFSNMNINTKD